MTERDLVQGARAIGRAPSFAAMVVMLLALSIGVNTTSRHRTSRPFCEPPGA